MVGLGLAGKARTSRYHADKRPAVSGSSGAPQPMSPQPARRGSREC
jgi:hypothetical protein